MPLNESATHVAIAHVTPGHTPLASREKTWRENADKLKDKICVTMLEGKDRDLTGVHL